MKQDHDADMMPSDRQTLPTLLDQELDSHVLYLQETLKHLINSSLMSTVMIHKFDGAMMELSLDATT
jgi:hypothetical protein